MSSHGTNGCQYYGAHEIPLRATPFRSRNPNFFWVAVSIVESGTMASNNGRSFLFWCSYFLSLGSFKAAVQFNNNTAADYGGGIAVEGGNVT